MSAFSVPGALLFRELSDALLPQFRIGIRLLGFWTTAWFIVAWSLASFGYLAWVHRASKNCGQPSPWTNVACWLVPYVNLFVPYPVIKEIYEESKPQTPLVRGDFVALDPFLFPLWWGTWLFSSVTDFAALLAPFKGTFAVVMLSFTALFVKGIAALSGSAIVWSIHVRQEELARVGPAPRATSQHSGDWGSRDGAAT